VAAWLVLALGCADGGVEGSSAAITAPLARDGEVLLDVREDGAAIFGRVLPAPDHADGDRVLTLRTDHAGQAFGGALEGIEVIDARFGEDGAIFVVGAFTGAAEPAPWGFSGVSSQAEKTQAQTMAANAAR
jgi:hypothetical protein